MSDTEKETEEQKKKNQELEKEKELKEGMAALGQKELERLAKESKNRAEKIKNMEIELSTMEQLGMMRDAEIRQAEINREEKQLQIDNIKKLLELEKEKLLGLLTQI